MWPVQALTSYAHVTHSFIRNAAWHLLTTGTVLDYWMITEALDLMLTLNIIVW